MIKEQRRRRRKKKKILKTVLFTVLVLAVAALIVFKVFVVERVEIEGNELYEDKKIEAWVLNDKYSWNSLYVYFKYKLKDTEELPFVDSMEISLKSPRTISISVNEKGVLGYLYVPSLGKNAYFDKDGFVVELSSEVIEGTTKVCGISVDQAELYKKLPLENQSILKTLLSVSSLLKKYQLEPEVVYVTPEDQILLSYGDIQVYVGGNTYLNEKMVRLQKIMPKIQKMKGTLHLEEWTETNTDVHFQKGILTEIPNDVQKVPGGDGKTEDTKKEKSGKESEGREAGSQENREAGAEQKKEEN